MALVYVSGVPTSGKTAIVNELGVRGYEAHDTDDPNHSGIAGWHNLETGEYVAGFNELVLTPDVLETHIWRLTDGTLMRFRSEAYERLIHLCGALREPEDIIAASDHIIWLATNEETIRERFKLSREVEWGQEEWQVQRTIERNQLLEREYRQIGAVIVDATQPLNQVVDSIIAVTAE